MNRSTTFPSPAGPVLARTAAAIASLTLATALTSCSFSVGELEPVNGEEPSATPTMAAEPDAAEQGEESPVEDAPDTGDAGDADTGDGLPMDASQAQAWAEDNYWLSGTGEAFYRLDWTLANSTTLQLTHSGSSNFIIVTYGADGTRYASMVNEIGAYEGGVTMSDLPLLDGPEAVEYIHIQADGAWTIGR